MGPTGRRHLVTGVTLLVLCAVVVAAAVVGWQWLFAELPEQDPVATDEPSVSCTPADVQPGDRIRTRDVRVSVFNAGTRSGLAGDTMAALTERGFREGDVANAPADAEVRRVEIWTTDENDAQARLVALQFGKKVEVTVQDVDLGPGVDVVVGDGFRGLAKVRRSLTVREPQEVCTPVATPDDEGAAAS